MDHLISTRWISDRIIVRKLLCSSKQIQVGDYAGKKAVLVEILGTKRACTGYKGMAQAKKGMKLTPGFGVVTI